MTVVVMVVFLPADHVPTGISNGVYADSGTDHSTLLKSNQISLSKFWNRLNSVA